MTPLSRPVWLSSLVALLASTAPASATSSSKRGLVFTPNADYGKDNYIWTRDPSDLTWYYNYGSTPSPVYSNLTQDRFEFVPMLWGAPSDTADTTFLTQVTQLIDSGRNISHVLTFNEPDGPTDWGGSDVDPTVAAKVWVNNIAPLRDLGVKVGLPACTGGTGGLPWTRQFLANCSALVTTDAKDPKNCTFDFVTLHWYGNFGGLASHIGEWYGEFPDSKIWVTEYNYDNQDLEPTQDFYNTSSEYMDRLDYLERYSLFAAFRSKTSNVGANAVMLSDGGELTDIGAWYLGRDATGVLPTDTQTSAAARGLVVAGWDAVVLGGLAAAAAVLLC